MIKTEPEQLIRNAINSLNSSLSSIGSEDIREEFSTDESDSHTARPNKASFVSKALSNRKSSMESIIVRRQSNKRILISIMVCNFVASLLCMNVSSFWPILVQQNHPDISSFSISILIALQPFALMITTPFCGD